MDFSFLPQLPSNVSQSSAYPGTAFGGVQEIMPINHCIHSFPPLGAQAQLLWMRTDTEQLIIRKLCCSALVMACKRVYNMREEQAVIEDSNRKQAQ